jgi:hypothetical protein
VRSEAGGGGGERGEFSLVKLLIRLAVSDDCFSRLCWVSNGEEEAKT